MVVMVEEARGLVGHVCFAYKGTGHQFLSVLNSLMNLRKMINKWVLCWNRFELKLEFLSYVVKRWFERHAES